MFGGHHTRALIALAVLGWALGGSTLGTAPAQAQNKILPSSADRDLVATAWASSATEDESDAVSEVSQELGTFSHQLIVPATITTAEALATAAQSSFHDSTQIYADGSLSASATIHHDSSTAEAHASNDFSLYFRTDATGDIPYALTGWISGTTGIQGVLSLDDGVSFYHHFTATDDSIAFDLSGILISGRTYRLVASFGASVLVDFFNGPTQSISGSYRIEFALPVDVSAPTVAGNSPRLRVWPNPFRARSSISVEGAPFTGNVIVSDMRGRRVREFRLWPDQPVLTWDARDQDGRALAAGIYFLRLDGPGGGDVQKVVMLR